MHIAKLSAAIASVALIAAPVIASAAEPVAQRASVASEEENYNESGYIVPAVAIIGVIGGVILIADDDEPTSP